MTDIAAIQHLVETARERGLAVKTGKPVDVSYLDQIASIMQIRFPPQLREYFTTLGYLVVEDVKVAGFSKTKTGAKDTFPNVRETMPGPSYLPIYGDGGEGTIWIVCRPGSNFGRVYSSAEDTFVAPDFFTWLSDKLGLLLDSYEEQPPA